MERAKASIDSGKYDSAIQDLTDVIKKDANNAEAFATRADAYLKLGKNEAAEADSTRAIELSPNFGWAYYLRGIARYWEVNKNFPGAMTDFTKLIELDPKLAGDGYRYRADIHNQYDKDYQAAIADATQAIKLNPSDGNAHAQRGWANTMLRNYEKARDDYRQAIKFDFASSRIYETLGYNEFQLKEYEQSASDTRKAIELDPNNQSAKNNLSGILDAIEKQKNSPANNQVPVSGTQSGTNEAEKIALFKKYLDEYNKLNQEYVTKNNAYFEVTKNKNSESYDTDWCRTAVALHDFIPTYENLIDKMEEMYKSGIAAKVLDGENLAKIKNVVEVEKYEIFKQKLGLESPISFNHCGEKEVTIDDLMAAAKTDTRNRIIQIMIQIGNLNDYFTAARKLSSLTDTASKAEICKANSDYEIESDEIEPLIEEFYKLYIPEPDPYLGGPAEDERTVTFDDPKATKQAEKLLEFRLKGFLPGKAQIKKIKTNFGCQ